MFLKDAMFVLMKILSKDKNRDEIMATKKKSTTTATTPQITPTPTETTANVTTPTETTTNIVNAAPKKTATRKKKTEKLDSIVDKAHSSKRKSAPIATATEIISEVSETVPEPVITEEIIAELKQARSYELKHSKKRVTVIENPVIDDPAVDEIVDEEDTISDVIDIESNSSRSKRYPSTRSESCYEINEGIPTRPLPTKNLPQMHGIMEVEKEPESKPRNPKTNLSNKPKRDGMEIAMEILDQYYEGTPIPDPRFRQHEE